MCAALALNNAPFSLHTLYKLCFCKAERLSESLAGMVQMYPYVPYVEAGGLHHFNDGLGSILLRELGTETSPAQIKQQASYVARYRVTGACD